MGVMAPFASRSLSEGGYGGGEKRDASTVKFDLNIARWQEGFVFMLSQILSSLSDKSRRSLLESHARTKSKSVCVCICACICMCVCVFVYVCVCVHSCRYYTEISSPTFGGNTSICGRTFSKGIPHRELPIPIPISISTPISTPISISHGFSSINLHRWHIRLLSGMISTTNFSRTVSSSIVS